MSVEARLGEANRKVYEYMSSEELRIKRWRGLSTLAAPTTAPLKASAPAALVSSSVLRGIVRVNASSQRRIDKEQSSGTDGH